jgi:hypothetical protein
MHYESLKLIRFLRFREEIAAKIIELTARLSRKSLIRDLPARSG